LKKSQIPPHLLLQALEDLKAEKERRRIKKAFKKPRTRKELYEWTRDVLGYKLARTTTKEGHRSPFEFLADAYFEKHPTMLMRACRGGGKTLTLCGIHHVAQTIFKDGIEIVHIGGTQEQSRDGYAYYAGDPEKDGKRGVIRRPPFDKALASEPRVTKTVLKSGSKVEIRTGGSERSVSGPHPHILAADEIDHIPWDILNTALQMPMSDSKYNAMTLLASSQYHSYGTMQALVSEASKRRIEVYQFDILDVMESCGREYPIDCKECPLYMWRNPYTNVREELCQGRGARADGHYRYRDVVSKFLTTDAETFALQNLLMRGTSQGMVYSQFSRVEHVKDFPLPDADISRWHCCAGVDLRSRGRIVVIAQAPGVMPNGKRMRHVIAEWKDDSATPSTIRKAAREMRENIQQKYGLYISVFWMERTASDEARDWKREGLNGRTIPTEVSNVAYGIGYCRDYLLDVTETVSVYFDPSCENLITALSDLYHCKRRKSADGAFEYDRDTPEKENDDFADAWRYGMVGGPVGIHGAPEAIRASGSTSDGRKHKWSPY
jgi:hypothetical protein